MDSEEKLRSVLKANVRLIYELGLEAVAKAASTPTLATVAEALSGTLISDDDEYAQVIEAALHQAITGIEENHSVRQGITTLFGIAEAPVQQLSTRRDEAAPLLGYSSGDSLRKSVQEGRPATDRLIGKVVDQLVALAVAKKRFDLCGLTLRGCRQDQSLMEASDPVTGVTDGDGLITLSIALDYIALFGPEPDQHKITEAELRVLLPSESSMAIRIQAYVSVGSWVIAHDTVDLITDKAFSAIYVKGSAVMLHPVQVPLGDAIIRSDGVAVGTALIYGLLQHPGELSATVQLSLRARPCS